MDQRQQLMYNDIKVYAAQHGWTLISDAYLGSNKPLIFRCNTNTLHERKTAWKKFKKNIKCRKCTHPVVLNAKKEFTENVEKFNGIIVGNYIDSKTLVECICSNNHTCFVQPTVLQQGFSLCTRCSGLSPEQAKEDFYSNIENLKGQVVGKYVDSKTPVACICSQGHKCNPQPTCIQQGQGMCVRCVKTTPEEAKLNFENSITILNGIIIGQYIDSKLGVECICPRGHTCYPIPTDIQQGRGMCYRCSGSCPAESEDNFIETIENYGGQVVGKYNRSINPVECICPEGHQCFPVPTDIQQGRGMCIKCTTPGYSNISLEFLSYFSPYMEVQHAENGGELYIPLKEPSQFWKKGMRVDGYVEKYNLCIEYNGDAWHPCDKCGLFADKEIHPLSKKPMQYLREKDKEKIRLLKSYGYHVIVMRECEYIKLKRMGKMDEWIRNELTTLNLTNLAHCTTKQYKNLVLNIKRPLQ